MNVRKKFTIMIRVGLCVIISVFFLGKGMQGVFANSAEVKLDVNQIIKASGTDRKDLGISYELIPDALGSPMPEGSDGDEKEFSISENNSYTLDFHFNHTGEYCYTLQAKTWNEKKGFTYDASVYHLKMYVSKDSNSIIRVIPIVTQGDMDEKRTSIMFTHTYKPKMTNQANGGKKLKDPLLTVTDVVKGNPTKKETFKIQLIAQNSSNSMPMRTSSMSSERVVSTSSKKSVKTITIKGEGRNHFGFWTYDHAGVYTYKVRELQGKGQYKYDKGTYLITDRVTDVDGQLIQNRTIEKYGTGSSKVIFTNIYIGGKNPGNQNQGNSNQGNQGKSNNKKKQSKWFEKWLKNTRLAKTGDVTTIGIWILIAGATITGGYIVNKKRKKEL